MQLAIVTALVTVVAVLCRAIKHSYVMHTAHHSFCDLTLNSSSDSQQAHLPQKARLKWPGTKTNLYSNMCLQRLTSQLPTIALSNHEALAFVIYKHGQFLICNAVICFEYCQLFMQAVCWGMLALTSQDGCLPTHSCLHPVTLYTLFHRSLPAHTSPVPGIQMTKLSLAFS